jgi:hypothetical protein
MVAVAVLGYQALAINPALLKIPRDRNGTFTPEAVRKYETIDNDSEGCG